MGGVNELQKKGTKTMANLPGSIKNLNTLLGEQLLDGGGSGGGGSSDFSTAQVTIIWTNPELEEVFWDSCPIIENDMINGALHADTSPAVLTVPLYKGKCYWNKTTRGLTLTGNIEELDEGMAMLITGDGTITISGGH